MSSHCSTRSTRSSSASWQSVMQSRPRRKGSGSCSSTVLQLYGFMSVLRARRYFLGNFVTLTPHTPVLYRAPSRYYSTPRARGAGTAGERAVRGLWSRTLAARASRPAAARRSAPACAGDDTFVIRHRVN